MEHNYLSTEMSCNVFMRQMLIFIKPVIAVKRLGQGLGTGDWGWGLGWETGMEREDSKISGATIPLPPPTPPTPNF